MYANCLMHKLSVNDTDLSQKVSFGAWFEGLKPNQILRNFAHQYNIRHVFQPPGKILFPAFKFRVQTILNLLRKTNPKFHNLFVHCTLGVPK